MTTATDTATATGTASARVRATGAQAVSMLSSGNRLRCLRVAACELASSCGMWLLASYTSAAVHRKKEKKEHKSKSRRHSRSEDRSPSPPPRRRERKSGQRLQN